MSGIPKTMRAIVYRGVNNLRLETLPVPRIGPGELLVKVAVCGVCPTDIKKIHFGTVPPPRVFGHETAGTIVKVGNRVKGFAVGERVALHHHVPCTKCHACRHGTFAQCDQYMLTGITGGFEPAGGGYAEYVRVMSFVLPGVVKIPKRNTFFEGAMQEPVNTVLKAIRKLAILPGDTVLVAGQGPIGLLFTRLLVLHGMKVVATDLMPSRLDLAKKWGARWIFKADSPDFPAQIKRLNRGRGLDAAVIAVPVDAAVQQARELLRGGAQTMLFAHTRRGTQTTLDLSSICVDEKDLIGSYSSDFTLQQDVARWVFSRKLDVRQLITHQFPLAQTAAAVELAAHPSADSLKVVVVHDQP
ncbi:MAG: Alcohol dehydrogenase GroES domain protein [Pedosphaera sp.]|nr:Alcohol dehydrogenase GroES domain protein [Pedosphaera sp.]